MEKLYLASLRGYFGDWVYYPCLMKLKDISERVGFADEIYKSGTLSEMVQRELNVRWGKEIKDYLLNEKQRFFNSLIVAVYDGEPLWGDITDLEGSDQLDASEIPNDVVASIGILRFSGTERLFALDGQERLVGIKEALKENLDLGDDELTVIFIAHRPDEEGKERSRKLFTTLNRNAKPVSKGEIIALDENDTMAIIVRRLVAQNPMFMGDRILNNSTDRIPTKNSTCLTTIGNLYDLLGILFTKIYVISQKKNLADIRNELSEKRLSDNILDEHYANACDYFERLANSFFPLSEFFDASDSSDIVRRYRHFEGGSVMFRPIGLTIMTEIVSELVEKYPLDTCFDMISRLPSNLGEKPYNGLIWHPAQKKLTRGKTLVKNLLLFMLDAYDGDEDKLQHDYAKALGVEKNRLIFPQP